MIQGIVTKNDRVWQGHPDVAIFNNRLFVVFRESDSHATFGHTKIRLTSCPLNKKNNFKFNKPITIAKTKDRFNCPRLSVIDENLCIVCDRIDASYNYIGAENDESKTKVFIFKSQNGDDWEYPILTNITGIVPDRIFPTDDGRFFIATHMKHSFEEENKEEEYRNEKLGQDIWIAEHLDEDAVWQRHTICHDPKYNLCEASICDVNGRYVCLMRENSGLGLPSFMSYSMDGISWKDIKPTRMFGCHRPVCGTLRSGHLLTTYREAINSFRPGYWAKNTFACITNPKSIFYDFTKSIILPIDHDNSSRSDSGYTGWVQLNNDSIFIVNYITNEAPMPYIKWYVINEEEF